MIFDVVIIGAGVIGTMIARELSKYNIKICVLEKENDVSMGASMANSGIIHAGFDAKPGTLKAKLNVEGSKMMDKIAKQLGVKYINNGSMVIGFSEEDKQVIKNLYQRGKENKVEGLEIINGHEARIMEPNLSKDVTCALYAKTGAIICPYELTIAAMGNAMDNGAQLKTNFEVNEISEKELGYYEIKSLEETINAKYIINCAGIYSDKIAKMIGDNSFEIKPRRGEYILMDKECGNIVKSTIFVTPTKMGKGILASPTVDGNLLLGPTSEDIENRENKETTQEGLEKVIQGAKRSLENITYNKIITSFCGLRAVGDTGDFIINTNHEKFINVAAIESPGLSASPAIAKYVKKMIVEMGLELKEKENIVTTRKGYHEFRELSQKDKNKIIKDNPTYGKIICRCEEVTEGEIIYAIHQNPGARDVDGIKRRTRATMGRCQSGFCIPSIIDILSRELNIPFEQITKKGKNSFMNIRPTKGGSNKC